MQCCCLTASQEPFVDYGASRNRIMDLASEQPNPPVFLLMLSADETVYNAKALRAFCEKYRDGAGANHEAYAVSMT